MSVVHPSMGLFALRASMISSMAAGLFRVLGSSMVFVVWTSERVRWSAILCTSR
ncbi:hypothetical protein BJX76DRAFT_331756 [Aspergillus varians]